MKNNSKDIQLNRSLGIWSALSLVIGTIIGGGVFVRQSAVLDSTGSTGSAILAWFAGGILTLAAGLTIAEIASQIPETGGLYVYMEKIYNRLWGFLSGWMQIIVYGPAMIAALGAYLSILLSDFFHFNESLNIPIALIAILVIGGLNLFPNKYGASFAVVTTICKMVPVIAIIIAGFFFGDSNGLTESVKNVHASTGTFGVAVLSTLFAFDGWILIANLGGEIKNPQKILPKAMTFGILGVMAIYLLIAFSVLNNIGPNKLHELGTGAIPYIVTKSFGVFGGKILSIGIIISILGCMNGKIMTFPRIMYAMAEQNQLPFSKYLSHLNPKTRIPNFSILVTLIIAGIMVVFFNADRISELCIFTVYCFYLMAFIGIFIMRKKDPNKERLFSVPLFPITPLVAIVGSLFVIVSEIKSDLIGVMISLGIVAIGIPIFFYYNSKSK